MLFVALQINHKSHDVKFKLYTNQNITKNYVKCSISQVKTDEQACLKVKINIFFLYLGTLKKQNYQNKTCLEVFVLFTTIL